jgi:hypothetical protein
MRVGGAFIRLDDHRGRGDLTALSAQSCEVLLLTPPEQLG